MKDDIVFYVDFPPTVNSYYGKTRSHVTYIKPKGKLWRENCVKDIHEQLGIDFQTLCDPLLVEVTLFMPDQRRRDVDNYMKALLDGISASKVWEDDSQIDQLFIYRGTVRSGGLVKVEISDAGPVIPYSGN